MHCTAWRKVPAGIKEWNHTIKSIAHSIEAWKKASRRYKRGEPYN
jgi:hypothetical protein